jgi:DNA processing protein
MADAVVVIESGKKGGSLTTADIANSYYREVFALPGRISDKMSAGCNRLISDNKALLFQSIDSFIFTWDGNRKKNNLFRYSRNFSRSIRRRVDNIRKLSKTGSMHVNTLPLNSTFRYQNCL